jgi:hypothetical protein
MLLGGSYDTFVNSAKNWTTYYNETNKRLSATVGLGFNEFFLRGTYGRLEARGTSKLKNLPVDGVALWRQEFYEVGLRHIDLKPTGGWYFDFAYFRSNATESIATKEPEVQELAASGFVKANGLSLGGGFLLRILGPVYLDGGMHFAITGLGKDEWIDSDVLNLGGWNLSVGITIIEQ